MHGLLARVAPWQESRGGGQLSPLYKFLPVGKFSFKGTKFLARNPKSPILEAKLWAKLNIRAPIMSSSCAGLW